MGIRSRNDDSSDNEGTMALALRKAGLGDKSSSQAPAAKPAEPDPVTDRQQDPAPVTQAPKPPAEEQPQKVEPKRIEQPAAREPVAPANNIKQGPTMTTTQTPKQGTLAERLNGRGKFIGRGTSSARAGELAKALQKTIGEALGDTNHGKGWNVQTLDHSNGLSFPVIMVTWRQADVNNNVRVAAFGLLIEPEDHRLSPRVEKFEQQTYEVVTTLGDVYNSEEFAAVVEAAVRRAQKLDEKAEIDHAGGIRVPSGLALTDTMTAELAFQAVTACSSIMDRYIAVIDEAPFTLMGRNMQNERLIGRLQISDRAYINELGEPIRANLIARVDSSRQGGALLMGDTNISTLYGYCEPVYTQPSQDPSRPKAPFYPMFVITGVQAGSDQTDLESLNLSIVNGVQLVSYRNAWADQFRRRSNTNNMHDVGALGLLTAQNARVNTKSDEFKAQFDPFMREYFECNSGMVVAIDIADIGPNAWAMDIYKACAAGNTSAIAAWEQAMDNLTGNQYSQVATMAGIKGVSPVIANGARYHAGHYMDPDRGLCDIRDVDLLAVTNAHGANTAPAEAYVESTVPMKGTDTTRAAERYACIDDVLQGRQVTTGYYTRLYFSPKHLPAMARACQLAKLMIQPSHMVHGLGSASRMGGFDFAGLLSDSSAGGLFGAGAQSSTPTTRW